MSEHHVKPEAQGSEGQEHASPDVVARLLAAYTDEITYQTYAHQPHATCLVIERQTQIICAVSENCQEFLGFVPTDVVGQHIQEILSEASYADVRELSQSTATSSPQMGYLELASVSNQATDLVPQMMFTLYHTHSVSANNTTEPSENASSTSAALTSPDNKESAQADVVILMLEPVVEDTSSTIDLQKMLNYVSSAPSLTHLYTRTAEALMSLLDYDQVLLCKRTNTHYEVVAECTSASVQKEMSSWLGQHYAIHTSATDTVTTGTTATSPLCKQLVSISDVTDQPVQLVGRLQADSVNAHQPATDQVDFTEVNSKAPSHQLLTALQAVGAQATLVSPLNVAGRAWGLIVCQHATPRYATPNMRALLGMVSEVVALLIAEHRHTATYQTRVGQPRLLQHLTRELLQHPDPQQRLTEQTELLLELVRADGVAFCLNEDDIVTAGSTPDADTLAVMRQSLHMTLPDPTVSHAGIDAVNTQLICTHTLLKDFPEFTQDNSCRGMLYMPINYAQTGDANATSQTLAAQERHHFVIWFRDAHTASENTHQAEDHREGVDVESPNSHYQDESRAQPYAQPWQEGDVSAALELRHIIAASLLRHAETRLSELRRRTEQVRESNMAKSEFLSRVSHELRTPLNAILGFAQVLSMRQLSDAQARGVTRILEAGKHLLNLVDEVLDISRVDAGHLHLSLETFSLWEVVLASIDIVQPLAADKRISLECVASEYYNPFVTADPQRLKQVIINLLANAIKYNHDDGRVTASFVAEDDQYVRLSIEDTGIGIAEDKMSRLFSPFDRLDIEQSSSIAGTGLGLTLSKSLVEAMGGTIGANSVLDEGTIFWITLPLAQLETASAPPKATRKTRRVPTSARRKVFVLYIEDNPSDLDFVQYQLSDYRGIQLLTSVKGEEGITTALQYQPDVVVVDQFLPDMASSDVVKILRSHITMKRVPIVGLRTPGEDAQELLEAGATMLIDKPLELQLLLAKLDEHANAQKSPS